MDFYMTDFKLYVIPFDLQPLDIMLGFNGYPTGSNMWEFYARFMRSFALGKIKLRRVSNMKECRGSFYDAIA